MILVIAEALPYKTTKKKKTEHIRKMQAEIYRKTMNSGVVIILK